MFKGHCCPKHIIVQAVYFKFRFGLSYREVEELMAIRGVNVGHATIQRWVFKFIPLLEKSLENVRNRSVEDGEWMRLMSKCEVHGVIYIEQWISRETISIFY